MWSVEFIVLSRLPRQESDVNICFILYLCIDIVTFLGSERSEGCISFTIMFFSVFFFSLFLVEGELRSLCTIIQKIELLTLDGTLFLKIWLIFEL